MHKGCLDSAPDADTVLQAQLVIGTSLCLAGTGGECSASAVWSKLGDPGGGGGAATGAAKGC
eukprot:2377505-Prymnesium_polylepis.1